jgi:hypothetical protein
MTVGVMSKRFALVALAGENTEPSHLILGLALQAMRAGQFEKLYHRDVL